MSIFKIDTPQGVITGFSSEHQVVVFSDDPRWGKEFPSEKAAFRWAEDHQGAGYGMPDSFEVKEFSR